MFFAQNFYGSDVLNAAFSQLSAPPDKRLRVTAKFLGVTEATLQKWLSGKSDPPRAACYALWHESDLGRAVTSAHSERAAYLWRSLAKSQESTLAQQRARIDELTDEINALKLAAKQTSNDRFLAANECFFKRY